MKNKHVTNIEVEIPVAKVRHLLTSAPKSNYLKLSLKTLEVRAQHKR